jgi:formylmethanofuran dehydrogenase subunit E
MHLKAKENKVNSTETLNELLEKCIAYHGHLCMGQVLGVKIAVKGLELSAPTTNKELIVIVENDRCIADAVQTVTNTRLGRRSFKLKDYGRMAATFLNTKRNKAYRVWTSFYKEISADDENAVREVLHLPDDQVVSWCEVATHLKPEEMPGKPMRIVSCTKCGERIFDGKDIMLADGPVCIACSMGSYYTLV